LLLPPLEVQLGLFVAQLARHGLAGLPLCVTKGNLKMIAIGVFWVSNPWHLLAHAMAS
jgi:hypothetical protein